MSQFSLKSLKSQLDVWRSHQGSNRQSAPDNIWRAAAEIARNTSPSYVAKKLSLNSIELESRMKANLDPSDQSLDFIQLEAPQDLIPSERTEVALNSTPSIEYQLKNGDCIKFNLPDLNTQNILAILIGGRA